MNSLETNRDLYLAVADLVKTQVEFQPPLEAYLLALRELGIQFEPCDSIGLEDFYCILRDAFSLQQPPFDAAWSNQYVVYTNDVGFAGWLSTISSQIVDLHEMEESGTLQNELRYFGAQSPRGAHWSNFDPCTYLECAMAGSIGGWEPGDDSGRSFVPGTVAVLDKDGKIAIVNPEDVPRNVYPLPAVSWELFRDILRSGQQYE